MKLFHNFLLKNGFSYHDNDTYTNNRCVIIEYSSGYEITFKLNSEFNLISKEKEFYKLSPDNITYEKISDDEIINEFEKLLIMFDLIETNCTS